MDAHDWFGWERVESPAATRAQLEAVHTAALIDMVESLCAAGGGAIDVDTAVRARRRWEAALHAAGGAVALCDALLVGRRAVRLLRAPAARPPRRAGRRRWASASSTPSRSAAAHALATGRGVARADPRLGRPPRQRDQRDLPRVAPTCCSSPSTSRRCIRGRGRRRTSGSGRGRGLHGQPAGAAGDGRRGLRVAGRARRRAAGAVLRAGPRAGVGRASTRTTPTRWRPAG